MSYAIYTPPPNTKYTEAKEGTFNFLVKCPHCGKFHHIPKGRPGFEFVADKAPCGLGYLSIHVVKEFSK